MSEKVSLHYAAIEDFRRARRKASLEKIMASITGKSADLLSYEDVIKKLKIKGASSKRLKEISLENIIGSVGRYMDFTRSFLPKSDSDEQRWATVETLATGQQGFPPIEVYQIGDAYFVLDGNHRASVARQLGATHIEAYVTKIRTPIPFTPDTQPDDLIIKAEYAKFLKHTRLDELRPGADLTVTAPGKYQILEEHIAVHRYFMGLEQKREIPYDEAVMHWYDVVYLPIERIIQERGILRDFPDRTATDLYLWLSEHRAELEKRLGWKISPEAAAADLVNEFSPKPERIISRIGEKLYDMFTPDELESGPPVGQWRREKMAARRDDRLFTGILVPVSGQETSWCALEQAIEVARREEGHIYGLHIVSPKNRKNDQRALTVKAEFEQRCNAAGIQGEFAIEGGDISRKICERARWTDLVVLHLAHPPGSQPIARLKSGFRTIIRRCPRPILAVPKMSTKMTHILLAYDGSPKAEEALFVSAYFAGYWKSSLVVVIVIESDHISSQTLSRAKKYLDTYKLEATFVERTGPVSESILKTAEEHESNLLIMGGYGYSPVLEIVLGSKIDHILRHSQQPMLICR